MLTDENISVLLVGGAAVMDEVETAFEENTRMYTTRAEDVEDASARMDEETFDCVVADIDDAPALFGRVFDEHPETGRIVYTEVDRQEVARELFEAGLDLFITDVRLQSQLGFGYVDRTEEGALERLEHLIQTAHDTNLFAPYPTRDEAARLEAVREYAVEEGEELDTLTALAREIFDVEKASIRVIDRDEQRYVSAQGFEPETVPREDTICTYTIMEDDGMLVIDDVLSDPRFEDNDWLRDNDIRWYAGATIEVEGQPIATFCLEDSEGREFSERDRRILRLLADQAVEMLELQQQVGALQQML